MYWASLTQVIPAKQLKAGRLGTKPTGSTRLQSLVSVLSRFASRLRVHRGFTFVACRHADMDLVAQPNCQ
jgi:hypothetical protein